MVKGSDVAVVMAASDHKSYRNFLPGDAILTLSLAHALQVKYNTPWIIVWDVCSGQYSKLIASITDAIVGFPLGVYWIVPPVLRTFNIFTEFRF